MFFIYQSFVILVDYFGILRRCPNVALQMLKNAYIFL